MVLSLPPWQHFPTFNCKEKVWITIATEYEPGIASCCVFQVRVTSDVGNDLAKEVVSVKCHKVNVRPLIL